MFVLMGKNMVGKGRVTLLGVVVSLLRGYGYRRQGPAACEGPVRYRHQGGGQEHTHQIIVIYKPKRWNGREMREGFEIKYIHTTNALSGQGAYIEMHILRGRWRSWEKQNKKKIEQHINIFHFKRQRCTWSNLQYTYIHTYIHICKHTYIYACLSSASVFVYKDRLGLHCLEEWFLSYVGMVIVGRAEQP